MKHKVILTSFLLLIVMLFSFGCTKLMDGISTPGSPGEEVSLGKGDSSEGLVKVLIGFKDKPGQPEQTLVKGVGGMIKYTYTLIPTIAASIPEAAIAVLKKNPNVSHVEIDSLVYAIDTELDNSWGVKRIGAGTIHEGGNKGTGIEVAVIDTGIDKDHSDLDANIAGGRNFVSWPPWKPADPEKWDDDHGHGTHVAGIIAAEDNGAGVVGVAPDAALYALKVLDRNGSGYVSDIISAIEWATDNYMDVVNMSLGATSAPSDFETACSSAEEAGVILVAAAGNESGGAVNYPAKYESVIAVSATDNQDNIAYFSSIGPEVELAAPGASVYSSYKDGGYTTFSGTSMASPHVAGTAALVIAAGFGDVRSRLQSTAYDLGTDGRDDYYGFGLVDAYEAVKEGTVNQAPTVTIIKPVDDSTFDSDVSILFEGTASDPEDGNLSISLSWVSSKDGLIGSGDSFSKVLSNGSHTITATVTDSGENSASDSINITVGTPVTENTIYVSSIEMWHRSAGPNRFVSTKVEVVSESGAVSGANVFLTTTLPDGSRVDNSGDTTSDGTVSFEIKSRQIGTYTSAVTNVVKDGWDYDSSSNVETSKLLEVY